MHVRPETPQDYAAIADIHVQAFGGRTAEALIVALHRHRAAFDPELSLVAEQDGQIVGHALFSPQVIRLMGADVPAVCLGPIGVIPSAQGKGVGAQLLATGHATASAKGYALSFLLGHPSYYPRFGYQPHAYGAASLSVSGEWPAPDPGLEARPPRIEDLPGLEALWRYEEADVDLSVRPGPGLLDWLSPNPAITARVWQRAGALAGYTRVHAARPERPALFLAADHAAARAIAAALAHAAGRPDLTLPLHPASASAGAFSSQATTDSWEAAMVLPLRSGVLAGYTAARAAGRPPGRVIWPVAFDLE